MADKDLQAELDSLLGGLDEKQGTAEEQKETATPAEAVPDSETSSGSAAPRKGMLGGGARPLGKGAGKLGTAAPARPATASTTTPAHPAAANTAAPARPAAANPPTGVLPSMAPVAKAKPAMAPLILSALSLVFTLVAIIMITQVNNSLKALQGSNTASFKAQQDKTSEQIKALNDQTKAVKNIQETLKTQLLDRDSEFQKQMRMSRETLDDLLEKLGKK